MGILSELQKRKCEEMHNKIIGDSFDDIINSVNAEPIKAYINGIKPDGTSIECWKYFPGKEIYECHTNKVLTDVKWDGRVSLAGIENAKYIK